MFPIQIKAEDALQELVDFNQKLLKGIESMVDVHDVEIGETPKEEVYREDKMVVYHYKPMVANPVPVPVLMVYALVNRPYMIDLEPGRSMVQNLLKMGLDLYLIDWGYPDRGDMFVTLDDYINGYMDNAIRVIRERHGLDKINLLGICQGGTFSLVYTALHPQRIRNLITMVTPVDFHVWDGLLNVWSQQFDVDRLVDGFGNIPGSFMNFGFLMLKPFSLVAAKYLGFVNVAGEGPGDQLMSFLRMEKWIFDSPDQAGAAFRQFLKDFYQENKLVKGELEIGGQRVDLKRITMPVFNVYATEDHLVPPASSLVLDQHIGSTDITTSPFPGGHIGIYVSGRAQRDLAPALAAWVRDRSRD
jgi:polyhydroxyalkanoate synthase